MSFRLIDYNYCFDNTVDLSATSEDTEFPVSNLSNFLMSKPWRSTGITAQRVVIDLQTAESIDTVVLLFDKQKDVKISPAATLKIEAHPVDFWGTPLFSQTITIDDTNHCAPLFLSTSQEFRFWSVYIDDPSNAWGYIEISKVFLGLSSAITQSPEIGFIQELVDQSEVSRNRFGTEYADTYPSRRRMSLAWRALTESDKTVLKLLQERVGGVKPVLGIIDPTAMTFADPEEYMVYGFIDRDFSATQVFHTFFDASFQIREAM